MKSEILEVLAEHRAQIEGKLAAEREARKEFALKAATGDTQAQLGAAQCAEEINKLESQLEGNKDATEAAKLKSSDEGKERLAADAKAAGQSATDTASIAVTELARKIDRNFIEGGELLAQLGVLTRKIRDELRTVVESVELSERQRNDLLEQIGNAAIGRVYGAALVHAMKQAHFGSIDTGAFSDEVQSLRRPGKAFSFADASEIAADSVAATVSRLLGDKA
jgi:hypothetical protein